jgi:putative transposase
MARISEFSTHEFYHLYNRGADKRLTFKSVGDRERFLSLLYLCNQDAAVDLKRQGRTLSQALMNKRGESLLDVAAYCLMPNHFHILVRAKEPDSVSRFMQKLCTGYTMYFNKRHERTGVLFEGKFKFKHVPDDRYLKYLISYIHLNPVKLIEPEWKDKGIRDSDAALRFLHGYTHSSYLDYVASPRAQGALIQREALLEIINVPSDFETHVQEWLKYGTS